MTDRSERTVIVLRPVPVLFGALAGVGLAVVLQQFAVAPLTTPLLLAGILAGAAVLGVALPTVLNQARTVPGPDRQGGRRLASVAIVAVLFAVAVILVAAAAQADAGGACAASINGEAAADRVRLDDDGVIDWSLSSRTGKIAAWQVTLQYAWLAFPLDTGVDVPPRDTQKSDVAHLDDYPRLGVGVYRLSGTVVDEDGGTCTGTVDVVVPGNPLLAPMGLAAAVLLVGGAVGAFLSGNRIAKRRSSAR